MSQTGKFIPGGGGFKQNPSDPNRPEPIRAPTAQTDAPSKGKRLFARGAAERLVKPVDPKRKPGVTIISVVFCVFFISLGWYYLAVIPAKRRSVEIQAELEKRTHEFEEFKKQEEARIAAEAAKEVEPAELKVTSKPVGATVTITREDATSPMQLKEAKPDKTAAATGDAKDAKTGKPAAGDGKAATPTADVNADKTAAPPGTMEAAHDIVQATPADFKGLRPGKVLVSIELAGYHSVTREVTLLGSKTVDLGVIDLARKVGKIKLSCQETGATYVLSGPDNYSHIGTFNANLSGLVEGEYTVVAEHKGWALPPIKLQVKDGEETSYQVSFPYSSIMLDSVPSGATVRAGKKVIGQTPMTLKELRPEALSYILELTGYKLGRVQFDVTEGVDLKKTVTLEKSTDLITSFGMVLVKLPGDFWGGKYPVRQVEYEKVMGTNPSFFRGANHPVESVTWAQAMDFCRKATEMEKVAGQLPVGYMFSLPTESQWETMLADTNLEAAVTSRDSDLHSTAEVGTSEPNQYGIYDMLGNVWAWCLDNFDPAGRTHVMRGGSWLSSKTNFPNSTVRNGAGENYRDKFTGFRVVLVKSPTP